MKRAAIFHGTDGKPTDHWLPWIKELLEHSGYEVFIPILPNSHAPSRIVYEQFLRHSGWNFEDNILVGHSSGSTTILNLLHSDWFPHVEAVILVGTFLNEKLTKNVSWYEPGQFDNLFLESYDPVKLKSKTDSFYFVHGDDDPYCDIADAESLSKQVAGVFTRIPNGHHLGGSSGLKDIPELKEVLIKNNIV